MITIVVCLCIAWLIFIAGVSVANFYRYNKIMNQSEDSEYVFPVSQETEDYVIFNGRDFVSSVNEDGVVFAKRDDE